jgi:DNA modification methylase
LTKLYKGDCLIESDKIESGSVDLILTDLPYGTVKGMGGDMEKYKHLSNADWDNVIDTNKIMQIANRILRKNGKMILTANQPFTTALISKAIPNLPHCYNMYWDKMHFANCLVANKAPVSYIEDVLVFSKRDEPKDGNIVRNYFREQRQLVSHLNYPEIGKILDITRQEANNWLSVDKVNWMFPTLEKYILLQKLGICKKKYLELKEINEKFKTQFSSTFNLWEGNKVKSNILKYKKDYDGHHPTQKPVLLLEDLIKTFSNENDLVVDLTMGSGSTGVAAKNLNRSFIGIEQDEKYFNIAKERIEKENFKLF